MDEQDNEIRKGIGSKTGAAMWKEIDDLVVRWARRDPVGANLNYLDNAKIRADLHDPKYATQRNEGMAGGRLVISIHPDLVAYIEAFYPKFFESKANIRRFGNTYKMFRIPEKI